MFTSYSAYNLYAENDAMQQIVNQNDYTDVDWWQAGLLPIYQLVEHSDGRQWFIIGHLGETAAVGLPAKHDRRGNMVCVGSGGETILGSDYRKWYVRPTQVLSPASQFEAGEIHRDGRGAGLRRRVLDDPKVELLAWHQRTGCAGVLKFALKNLLEVLGHTVTTNGEDEEDAAHDIVLQLMLALDKDLTYEDAVERLRIRL